MQMTKKLVRGRDLAGPPTQKKRRRMGDGPRGSQCPELEEHDCKNDQLPADPQTVWDLLLQLDPYKSMGPKGIHHRTLKELADVIEKPPSMIFELSWESREATVDWKLASVVMIFKKGEKEDPGNYRPVSLISVPGKVMEKIILGGILGGKTPERLHSHWSQPARLYECLLIKPDFLL
ncbi:RNA-directed DNA polymerase from mobile element jockey [Pitangus sulphuratus]|nr:RNA-directed DNA polymerase from mobile element jockey [Pitangus sulphuratus]